jgi:DnaJ-class molecular chaperone
LYGEFGLKNGVTNSQGQKVGGYMFMGNAKEIFDDFFSNTDPLATDFEIDGSDVYGSLLGDAHGAKHKLRPETPKDVCIDLKCSLSELYNGSLKNLTYSRDKTHWNNRVLEK